MVNRRKMVREASLSNRGASASLQGGGAKPAITALPSTDGIMKRLFKGSGDVRAVFCTAGNWVVPRKRKLPSHVGRELFVVFGKAAQCP